MKCQLCSQRKAKRACPARSDAICPQCCGTKRIFEIDCPESCEYLKIGREREADMLFSRHIQSLEPVKRERHHRVIGSFREVMAQLEMIIADERRSSPDLGDENLHQALELLLKTLNTEDRGVIYESKSDEVKVEALRRQLRDAIQSFRYPQENERRDRLLLKDAVECLEVLGDIVEHHLETAPASMSFVDFLARYMPRRDKIESAGPQIIIPGR